MPGINVLSAVILVVLTLYCSCAGSPNINAEKDGYIEVEAEDFDTQTLTNVRAWKVITTDAQFDASHDVDSSHAASASQGAYLEVLPDTRTNHDEELIRGENFSNQPGKLAVLHYRVQISNPGKYYVWVRAFSTGTEDNGIHVGLNNEWPLSGQRMQWCEGKHQWTWESKQRTPEQHCGVERQIYLDIPKAGVHEIMFSMREDGFEFDKWALSKVYERPE